MSIEPHIEKREDIVIGLLIYDGRVLLVKQTYPPKLWSLPGGVRESVETLTGAVIREMREETGLEVTVKGLFAMRDRSDQACFVFTVEKRSGTLPDGANDEIEDIGWFSVDDIREQAPFIEDFTRTVASQALATEGPVLPKRSWLGRDGKTADMFCCCDDLTPVDLYSDTVLPRLRFRFCPMCRATLSTEVIDDDRILRVTCPVCRWVHYPSNALGVNVVIVDDRGIVAIHPMAEEGGIALPGGHVEYGESPQDAAIRESYEETGLSVEITECLGWYYEPYKGYPGPMVSFMFEAKTVGGQIRSSQEGRVAIYPADELPYISPRRIGSLRTWNEYVRRKNPFNRP